MILRRRTMFAPTITGRRGIKQCEALLGVAADGSHRLLRKRRAKTLIAARQNFSQVLSKMK